MNVYKASIKLCQALGTILLVEQAIENNNKPKHVHNVTKSDELVNEKSILPIPSGISLYTVNCSKGEKNIMDDSFFVNLKCLGKLDKIF